MLSICAARSGYPKFDWFVTYPKSLEEVASIISSEVYGNAIWTGGVRLDANFSYAAFCVLDFDEGVTKEEAREMFSEYAYVMGPTKSDGLVKKKTETSEEKPACDRFRVVLRFSEPIYDLDVFKYNMRLLTVRFGSDRACTDGAKAWQPCKAIEVIQEEGAAIEVVTTIPLEETTAFKAEKHQERIARLKGRDATSRRVKAFFQNRIEEGTKNQELYVVALTELELGKDPHELFERISRVPAMQSHASLLDTFRSACKKAGVIF